MFASGTPTGGDRTREKIIPRNGVGLLLYSNLPPPNTRDVHNRPRDRNRSRDRPRGRRRRVTTRRDATTEIDRDGRRRDEDGDVVGRRDRSRASRSRKRTSTTASSEAATSSSRAEAVDVSTPRAEDGRSWITGVAHARIVRGGARAGWISRERGVRMDGLRRGTAAARRRRDDDDDVSVEILRRRERRKDGSKND